MDYKDFKQRIGNELDVPDEEQKQIFLASTDSVHVSVAIGYYLGEGEYVARDIVPNAEVIFHALDMLEERNAVRGEDYIITCYVFGKSLILSLHTLNTFLSDEDFPDVPKN